MDVIELLLITGAIGEPLSGPVWVSMTRPRIPTTPRDPRQAEPDRRGDDVPDTATTAPAAADRRIGCEESQEVGVPAPQARLTGARLAAQSPA